jgi:hypothetical protein
MVISSPFSLTQRSPFTGTFPQGEPFPLQPLLYPVKGRMARLR